MYRLFWFGCLVAVMAACAVYMTADYAERHPDSLTGCCVRGVYHVAMEMNPVTVVAAGVGHQAVQLASYVQPKREPVHVPASCTRSAGHCTQKAPEQFPPPPDVIDLSMLTVPEPGGEEAETPVEDTRPCGAEEDYAKQSEAVEGITVPPTPFEDEVAEEDPVPDVMPPCKDEDEEPCEMMHSMEELIQEDLENQKEYVNFWMNIFGIKEEAVPEELPMPTEVPADEPKDEETFPIPLYNDRPEPTTPETTEMPAEETPKTDEPPMPPDPISGEESEMRPGSPPDCREDPHHDQHYPGCPYMGGCPGMHHVPPPPLPEPKVKVKKKKAAAKQPPAEDPAIHQTKFEEIEMVEPPMSREIKPTRRYVPAWKNRGSYPDEPEVDTMEFRPSDAKKGEFDPKPW